MAGATESKDKKAQLGKKVPAFTTVSLENDKLKLSTLKGKNVVLFFYPKDNTSGCTREGEDFRDQYKKFTKKNTVIYGVSRDSLKSHKNFREKYDFPFDLISDPEEELCNLFDVMKMKSMYGRKYRGIERSTFVIDDKGKLIQEWRKVKVPGHVEDVLNFVSSL